MRMPGTINFDPSICCIWPTILRPRANKAVALKAELITFHKTMLLKKGELTASLNELLTPQRFFSMPGIS